MKTIPQEHELGLEAKENAQKQHYIKVRSPSGKDKAGPIREI
jgi:hypothetical protein